MKILFQSYAFYPSVGGIESSALLFIEAFQAAGHQVRVMTSTALGPSEECALCPVIRETGLREQIKQARWADLIYQHNPSLQMAGALLARKPMVVSVRTWIARTDGSLSWIDRLKAWWISRHTVIANSQATADSLPGQPLVIENAYDAKSFKKSRPFEQRSGAAFVGRLVSDKGADLAVAALAMLKQSGHPMPLTIVGSGEEAEALKALARSEEVEVKFTGKLNPEQVVSVLNRHRYLLIPSRWTEPFGIVALEGIACGCIPIAADRGGLVSAVGNCGPLFKSGDASSLAEEIAALEASESLRASFLAAHEAHLEQHAPQTVAAKYLDVFESTLNRS